MTPTLLAATSGPSWYWYATRGLGTVALVTLTVTVVLGVGTAARWSGAQTPGFVYSKIHRNISLFGLLIVAAHVTTTVLDPFAQISVRDALVPFTGAYRPIWLGLGVVAAEVLLAVALTSVARGWLGPRRWKTVHWAAYGSWPLAVMHGLGTGSDSRAPWMVGLAAACVAAVWLAVVVRLLEGRLATLPLRLATGVLASLLVWAGGQWALGGPFMTGWAARAGTPTAALSAGPVHPGNAGFADPLSGLIVRTAAGQTQIALRDSVDSQLTFGISSAAPGQALPTLVVRRGTRILCQVPAEAGSTLYAVCGPTRLEITLQPPSPLPVGTASMTALLVTSGPLR